jgi:iron complex transport system substrate-binding protein
MRSTTRITCALVAAAALFLGACGSDDRDDAEASAATTSTETAATPPTSSATATTVPATTPTPAATDPAPDTTEPAPDTTAAAVEDRRVVALDELTALGLISIGVFPDVVLTTLGSETFPLLVGELDALAAAATPASGAIEVVPFTIAEPSLEQLAGLGAEVLVGVANPNITGRIADYEAIAPIVLTPLEATWQEQLLVLADEFGVRPRAARVIDALAERTASVADTIEATDAGVGISVLTARVGTVIAVNASGAVGALLADVGATRPAAQEIEGAPGIPFVPVDPEQLAQHDADIVLLPTGEVFDITPITDSPLFASLSAVGAGSVYEVVGDHWVLGGSAFGTWWMLADLDSIIGGGEPATIDGAVARWSEFLAAVS